MSGGDFTTGDVQITQQGQGSIGNFHGELHQQFGTAGDRARDPFDDLPNDAMAEFIRATAKALTVLDLPPVALRSAQDTVAEMRSEAAKPPAERKRLAQLASTLYEIVQDAAGHALGSMLLGLWHP